MKGQSRKDRLLQALRGYLVSLSEEKRNQLAASLNIVPLFTVEFIDSDGRPKQQTLQEFQNDHTKM